jgi:hypothetical protein
LIECELNTQRRRVKRDVVAVNRENLRLIHIKHAASGIDQPANAKERGRKRLS